MVSDLYKQRLTEKEEDQRYRNRIKRKGRESGKMERDQGVTHGVFNLYKHEHTGDK